MHIYIQYVSTVRLYNNRAILSVYLPQASCKFSVNDLSSCYTKFHDLVKNFSSIANENVIASHNTRSFDSHNKILPSYISFKVKIEHNDLFTCRYVDDCGVEVFFGAVTPHWRLHLCYILKYNGSKSQQIGRNLLI